MHKPVRLPFSGERAREESEKRKEVFTIPIALHAALQPNDSGGDLTRAPNRTSVTRGSISAEDPS